MFTRITLVMVLGSMGSLSFGRADAADGDFELLIEGEKAATLFESNDAMAKDCGDRTLAKKFHDFACFKTEVDDGDDLYSCRFVVQDGKVKPVRFLLCPRPIIGVGNR